MILAVGRLAAQKDFGVLLAAATHWRDLDPQPQVMIAGDGSLAADLRAQAASLGVDATFLGRRDDVAELLAAATVVVLPSRWEGQPLILQEALRAGAAIVATRVGGIPDLVGDDAAVLVRPGDAQALAVAVRAVLTDPPLAARLRAAAAVRGAALPTEADAVAAALAAYADTPTPLWQ
jgi:glycosyltransferase involved in cell wall biosynthesis